MTPEQLADAIMELALATQTLSYVVRQLVKPGDKVATDGLDLAQAEIDDVMARLAHGGVTRRRGGPAEENET
jgi:hypothetical protein